MDNDFGEFVHYVEEDDVYLPVPRQILRDHQNPFEVYTDVEILQKYRFGRRTLEDVILPLVYGGEVPANQRGLPVPPIVKLCVALRFYATGSFQRTCGDLQGISQSTVCRIVEEVSEILARNLGRYVKFPSTPEEVEENKNLFYNIAQFPDVSACVDGTHIEIKSPGGSTAENFRNRNAWMSLNVQGVAGPRCEFLDIVIRWPGSSPVSWIFNSSSVKLRYEDGTVTGLLLGDSAYPQTRYLYTPVPNPATPAEQRYNSAHMETRNVVGRMYRIWKSRFRCLSTSLNCSLQKTTRIIAATAVLHNIAIKRLETIENNGMVDRLVPNPLAALEVRGNIIRAAFIERHFYI